MGIRFALALALVADGAFTALAGIDDAAWIGEPDEAAAPRFLRFECPFEGTDEPLTLEVSGDPRYILLLDGKVVGRGPDNGDVGHWYARRMTLRPGPGPHLLTAVVWKLGIAYENGRTVDRPENDRPFAHLSWRTGFALAAEGTYDKRLTTGTARWRYAPLSGTRPIGRGADGWADGDGSLAAIRRMSVRGLQSCMHEIMFDCPFWEQQMYGGPCWRHLVEL